jgi:hypothetical protein
MTQPRRETTVLVPVRSGVEAVRRRRVVCGLALAGVAGTLLGQAWTSQDGSWWLLGVATLLSAGLMVLSAVYIRTEPERRRDAAENVERTQQQQPKERWEIQPMLGEILVRHGHVTSDELLLALKRQAGIGLLLGEVLVDMRLVSLEQIDAAIREQSAWRNARRFQRAQGSQQFQIVAQGGPSTTCLLM